ncbi:transposase [Kitasatospora sp. NBC_01539]|uniref:transposase n=1 Tax=Kitasatospora sp. NBC_01539 TaxID=2903577 RepID=UPI0038602F90
MTGGRGLLDLSPGAVLVLNGVEWTAREIAPQLGRLVLEHADGRVETRSISWLVNHRDARLARAVVASAAAGSGIQPRAATDLTESQLRQAVNRAEHVREAVTGFREGSAERARPGEPRPAYNPDNTTLTERRQAKVDEVKVMDPREAQMLGLSGLGLRTLQGLSTVAPQDLVLACADGRWTRRRGGRRSITVEIREAIFAVRRECAERSRITMSAKHRLLHQYVNETFPDFPQEKVPCRHTLAAVWLEWFGSEGGRQRYVRSAAAAAEAGVQSRIVVHRPGQVLALDSTPLPVKLRETVFGEPTDMTLTLALDLYTHSAPAFRLTPKGERSVDVAMLLRDVMLPLPMRASWGEEMQWPYPGVPSEIVAEFAGHDVAALPFFAPETVTTDHGGSYKSHDLVAAERELGCNVLPARALRPTDKFAVERAFSGFKTLLFEHLLGFTGTDVADRGSDPELDATLTVNQMEHLIATWIVQVWQNRELGEYAPAWGPGERHSPNSLFAAAMNQGGFSLRIPDPSLYYRLLPRHNVKIHPRRGVKILGLWYSADLFAEDRYQHPSARGGRHAGRWVVSSDRRDRRTVFFQDPDDHSLWHTLRWNGLPPEGEIPAFSDRTAADLLAEVARHGLAPKSDAELLPLLLGLLGDVTPVSAWPSRSAKKKRVARSHEQSRAAAAAADRPTPEPVSAEPAVMPARWRDQSRAVQEAVDSDRRRRRQAATASGPTAPPLLDDSLRGGLFLLPAAVPDSEPLENT